MNRESVSTEERRETAAAGLRGALSAAGGMWQRGWADRSRIQWIVLAVLLALVLVRGFSGGIAIRAYVHDVPPWLDGAWRVLNGHRPHHDFPAHLGPTCYLIPIVGTLISSGISALGWGQAVFGAVAALWATLLTRRRMDPLPAMFVCASLTLLAIAPYVVGARFTATTMAMFYNRVGYFLLAAILIEAAAPVRGGKGSSFAGGLSTGIACGLALFLKVTYLVHAGVLVLAFLFYRRQTAHRLAGIGAGFLAAVAAVLAFVKFDVAAIRADLDFLSAVLQLKMGPLPAMAPLAAVLLVLVTAAVARIPWRLAWVAYACAAGAAAAAAAVVLLRSRLSERLYWIPLDHATEALELIVLAVLVSVAVNDTRGDAKSLVKRLWAAVVVLAVGIAAMCTNTQHYGLPLSGIFALILLAEMVGEGREKGAQPASPLFVCAVAALGLLIALPPMVRDAAGLAYAAGSSRTEGVTKASGGHALSDFATTDAAYMRTFNDGIELLRQSSRPGESVMSLAFDSPFAYALGRPPALGRPLWLAYQYTFDDRNKPPAESFIGTADLVMVEKETEETSESNARDLAAIWRNYGAYVTAHYRLAGESRAWRLYRRAAGR